MHIAYEYGIAYCLSWYQNRSNDFWSSLLEGTSHMAGGAGVSRGCMPIGDQSQNLRLAPHLINHLALDRWHRVEERERFVQALSCRGSYRSPSR